MSSTNKNLESKEKILPIGGQAVIEGVMMRSLDRIATAVRRQDGTVEIKTETFQSLVQRKKQLNIPIIRGAITLIEVMMLGMRHLNFSANIAVQDIQVQENEERRKKGKKEKKYKEKGMSKLSTFLTVSFALILGLALFFAFPLYVTTEIFNVEKNALTFNLIAGIIRIILFLGYIYLISLLKDVKRLFQYHGAEHKTIFTFEKKLPLTVENVRKEPRLHPRCGTSFLVMVLLISLLFFAFLDAFVIYLHGSINLFIRLATHLPLVPLVGGLGYEAIKASAKKPHHPLVRLSIWPGLALQRITTQEPDDSMIETAIIALLAALDKPYDYLLPEPRKQPADVLQTFL